MDKIKLLGATLLLALSACGQQKENSSSLKESSPNARQSLVVMTYNAAHLGEEKEKDHLLSTLKATSEGLGPDLVFLQNITDEEFLFDLLDYELRSFAYRYVSLSGENSEHKKSAVLSRFEVEEKTTDDSLEVLVDLSSTKRLHVFMLPQADILTFLDESPTPNSGETHLVLGSKHSGMAVSRNAKFQYIPLPLNLKRNRAQPQAAEILIQY